MNVLFKGTTNKKYCMINVAIFLAKNGDVFTVDRSETTWMLDDNGTFTMCWKNCYIREVNGKRPFASEQMSEQYVPEEKLRDMMHGAELLEMQLEDDADDNYIVRIDTWKVEV